MEVNKMKNKEIKVTYCGSDGFIINGYMIHELCQGKFAVYTPEQLLDIKEILNISYPTFRYVCNAISYCIGNVNERMLEEEDDLRKYLERKEQKK
jgi:hypothetical protein